MARSGPRPKAAHGTALDLGRPGDAVGRLIALALEEDVGPGDRTAEACVPPSARGSALIFAKEPLIVSGISAAARVFRALDPGCELEALAGESDAANPGEGIRERHAEHIDQRKRERARLGEAAAFARDDAREDRDHGQDAGREGEQQPEEEEAAENQREIALE